MPNPSSVDVAAHARQEWGNWVLLLCCLTFFGLTLAIAPSENCTGGQCYPTLVWVARAVGGLFTWGFAMLLITNPSRGVRYDPQTDELCWWASSHNAYRSSTGRIRPAQIARIEFDETDDEINIRLVDQNGQPVPGFSNRVLPVPGRKWAPRVVARWPHIELRSTGRHGQVSGPRQPI